MIPNLTDASLTIPLVPFGTENLDRLNQLDIRGSKAFTFGRTRVEAQIELFNTLNSDAADTVRSTNFGTAAAYHQAASAVQGRINSHRRADEMVMRSSRWCF